MIAAKCVISLMELYLGVIFKITQIAVLLKMEKHVGFIYNNHMTIQRQIIYFHCIIIHNNRLIFIL